MQVPFGPLELRVAVGSRRLFLTASPGVRTGHRRVRSTGSVVRFSVVTSINAMEFFPEPAGALREMYRVVRPGGRLAITMGEAEDAPEGSTEAVVDGFGQWQWNDAAARSAMEEAGFTGVEISVLPVFSKALLARGTKPASPIVETPPRAAAATVE